MVFTDRLIEFDRSLFGVDEMAEEEIRAHARTIAEQIATMTVQPEEESCDGASREAGVA